MARAKETLPTLIAEIRIEAQQAVDNARSTSRTHFDATQERAGNQVREADAALERTRADVGQDAQRHIADARVQSEALLREIAGQGPQKTLNRGFALVKDATGKALTSASQIGENAPIEIQFRDGSVPGKTTTRKPS